MNSETRGSGKSTRRRAKAGGGQLLWSGKGWSARYWAIVDGERVRRCVALGTDNRAVAAAKLARLAGGEADAAAARAPETFEQAARRIVAASAIRTKSERLARLVKWAFPHIGTLSVTAMKASHVKGVVTAAREQLGATSTVGHILHDISAVLLELWSDEAIVENVAKRVRLSLPGSTLAPRVVLTDAELQRFVSCDRVDLEIRMLALTSRCLAGMRASDLHAFDWRYIDLLKWADAFVPRPKIDKLNPSGASRHAIPGVLRGPLESWWRAAGCPTSGPVFPVRTGKRAGLPKRGRQGYARRLRDGLWTAGVVRPLPGWDAGKPSRKLCQLQSGDEHNSRADFHSCRRAFATAAARAGMNVQDAMALVDHGDATTHMRYVRAADVLHTPLAMLPNLSSGKGLAFAIPPRRRNPSYLLRAQKDSNLRPTAPEAVALSS